MSDLKKRRKQCVHCLKPLEEEAFPWVLAGYRACERCVNFLHGRDAVRSVIDRLAERIERLEQAVCEVTK